MHDEKDVEAAAEAAIHALADHCALEVTDAQGEAVARAALNAVPRWRPISEAPKDGTRILLLGTEGQREVGHWWPEGTSWSADGSTLERTGVWWSGGGWFEPDEVVGWMPLPPPPTDTTEERDG